MPTRIDTLEKVSEKDLQDLIKSFKEIDEADIVTAFSDGKGTFTVESTIFDNAPGSLGTPIIKVGKMSTFGGPNDPGVTSVEGLALFEESEVAANPDLFLASQPPGTTGLAKRLNPDALYLACRWDYPATPKAFLKKIKVKVTNPANGKSVEARPADFGPAEELHRVADLSPGLARALGLATNNICKVEIPTPETGVATGVNLAEIDATIFPPDMARQLVVMTTSNNMTYWIVNQVGPEEGGQTLMRRVGKNKPEILRSDTAILPIKADDQVPAAVADELNKFISGRAAVGPGGSPPGPGDDINAKVFAAAQAFVGNNTDVPGTEHGNFACAWAVNQVVRLAFGKPISADEHGRNGLGTAEMADILEAHHTKLSGADQARPGVIIISPTVGGNHGHVGIVGTTTGSVDDTQILSNSSSAKKFAQNYTIAKWKARYATKKHLDVLFYQLNGNQF